MAADRANKERKVKNSEAEEKERKQKNRQEKLVLEKNNDNKKIMFKCGRKIEKDERVLGREAEK